MARTYLASLRALVGGALCAAVIALAASGAGHAQGAPVAAPSTPVEAQPLEREPAAPALVEEAPPSNIGRGDASDADIWRELRRGEAGTVTIPDKKAAVLIQSEGEAWRAFRNGPLSVYGGWALLGMIAVLAAFFAIRGRVRIQSGPSGETVERFNTLERFGHWLVATSFIILALTGLNVLYGRYVVKPVLGADAFAAITQAGKWLHNHVAFAFMVGLVIIFVLWVKNNIPHPRDITWFLKGGGIIGNGHPRSKRFNAGQKLIFWSVILGGASISLSGLQLLFPYQIALFGKTFAFLGAFGLAVPTDVSAVGEMQLAQAWHTIVSLFLITVIIAHIYIGSIGMEGAFAAMGSGHVDRNWALEHHDLWVEDMETGTVRPSGHAAAASYGEGTGGPANGAQRPTVFADGKTAGAPAANVRPATQFRSE